MKITLYSFKSSLHLRNLLLEFGLSVPFFNEKLFTIFISLLPWYSPITSVYSLFKAQTKFIQAYKTHHLASGLSICRSHIGLSWFHFPTLGSSFSFLCLEFASSRPSFGSLLWSQCSFLSGACNSVTQSQKWGR